MSGPDARHPFSHALRGEFTRLLSTRLPLWTMIIAVSLGAGLTGLISLIGPENATPPLPGLDTTEGVPMVLSLLGVTLFAPALIGTVAISSEYRHRTIGSTFLAVPRRGLVLLAKLIVYGVLGIAYGVVFALGGIGGILAGAAVHGVVPAMPQGAMISTATGYVFAAMIYLLLGVGIGAVARNQLVAIGITLGYFYLLENILMMVPGVNVIYGFLPGGATAALTGSGALAELIASETGIAGPTVTLPVVGAGILLGYVAVAAIIAGTVSLRRDLT